MKLLSTALVKSAIENFKGKIPAIPAGRKFNNEKEIEGGMTWDEKVLFALSFNLKENARAIMADAFGKKAEDLSERDATQYLVLMRDKPDELNRIKNLKDESDLYENALWESIRARIPYDSKRPCVALRPGYRIVVGATEMDEFLSAITYYGGSGITLAFFNLEEGSEN